MGGVTGQHLAKASDDDYDTAWVDAAFLPLAGGTMEGTLVAAEGGDDWWSGDTSDPGPPATDPFTWLEFDEEPSILIKDGLDGVANIGLFNRGGHLLVARKVGAKWRVGLSVDAITGCIFRSAIRLFDSSSGIVATDRGVVHMVASAQFVAGWTRDGFNVSAGKALTIGTTTIRSGSGDPEGTVTAPAGSLYQRTDGGVYKKATGTGNTGWVELAAGAFIGQSSASELSVTVASTDALPDDELAIDWSDGSVWDVTVDTDTDILDPVGWGADAGRGRLVLHDGGTQVTWPSGWVWLGTDDTATPPTDLGDHAVVSLDRVGGVVYATAAVGSAP